MFNFSFGEILVLAVIGLIVIGPKQLPQVAQVLARVVAEFRRAIREINSTIVDDVKTSLEPKEATKIPKEDSNDKKPDEPT